MADPESAPTKPTESISAWNMDDKPKQKKVSMPASKNPDPNEEKQPEAAPVTSYFKKTKIWIVITIVTAIVVKLLLADSSLGIAIGWITLGTFLLWPYIAGLITIVVFIKEYSALNKD
ncbi:MAG: hypothetical protein WCO19_04460 [Candidatus Saccharibacteria bacterium]